MCPPDPVEKRMSDEKRTAGSSSGFERTPDGYTRIPMSMLLLGEEQQYEREVEQERVSPSTARQSPHVRQQQHEQQQHEQQQQRQQQQQQQQQHLHHTRQQIRIMIGTSTDLSDDREGGFRSGPVSPESGIGFEHEEVKRRRWTKDEDQALLDIVAQYGARHWNQLAQDHMPDRTGQQLRLRYTNHLRFSDEEKHAPFSVEEDQRILQAGDNPTRKWMDLAIELGRSHNAIKNRYNLLMRHRDKELQGTSRSHTRTAEDSKPGNN